VLNNEVSFKEVIDADQAKLELQKLVDFIKNPNNYTMLGVMIPGPMDACSLACPDWEYVARRRRGGLQPGCRSSPMLRWSQSSSRHIERVQASRVI
jgi:hypothetical protein